MRTYLISAEVSLLLMLASADGQFARPLGLAVDGQGNIYVSDQFNNRVQKFREQ
jgi:DNA-binding beta-propeller fold protein YncE